MKSHSLIIPTPVSINLNTSISELMQFVRTAFLPSDFEIVEKILEDWEKKKDIFEADNCGLIREKFEMEEEIERLKKIVEEKDDVIVKLKSEITEFGEGFENRVLSLEKDVELIMEQNHVADEETEQNQEADNIFTSLADLVTDLVPDPEPSQIASGNQSLNTSQFQNVINLDDDDDDVSVPDGDINPDIDTTMHKRKQSSESDHGIHDDVSMPAGVSVTDVANGGPIICRHVPRRKLSLPPVRL